MTQYKIMLIYSLLSFMTITFRNSIQEGTKFFYLCQKLHPMMSWKVCTNSKNTRVRAIQNRFGIVRLGYSSEDIDAQLSKIEDNGEESSDQKLRLRNFDARHGKVESGAVIKSRKGAIGVEGGKGVCYQWKEKGQCSQGDQCSFRHESNDRAPKPEHTAATNSEPVLSRG